MATATLKRTDDPAYAAGERLRRNVSGATTYNAAGTSNLAQSQAMSQVTTPLRNFVRGFFGASQDEPAAPATPAPAPRPAAAAPASPTPTSAARTPAAPAAPAAPASPVVGQFNGRDITSDDAASIAARLPVAPAGAPVVTGPNGSFAFSRDAAPAAPAVAAPAAPAGGGGGLRVATLRGDLDGAEAERTAALRQVNDAIGRMEIGPSGLNSRGKRDLYATLVGQRNALTGRRVDQATTLATEGAHDANAASIEGARLAQGAAEGAANRSAQATLQRQSLDASNRQARSTLQRDDGTTLLLRGDGSTSTLTDAQGNPIRQASTISGKDRLDFVGEQIKALNADMAQNPYVGADGKDPRVAQLAQLQAQAQALLQPQSSARSGAQGDGGGFQEGGIYQDAQGRRAKYVNGKFVPAE